MDIDPKVKALIDDAKATALGITDIDRDSIISLLSIEPGSKECEYLGRAARDVARINNKNQAKVELP